MTKKNSTKPLILFDIDGTLVLAKTHGKRYRFVYAVEKVFGVKNAVDVTVMEGWIDKTIITSVAVSAGVKETALNERLPEVYEAVYEYFIANNVQDYANSILPGVKPLLTKLQKKAHIGLLTGNIEKIARKKLEAEGLNDYFEFGLFGHEAEDRVSLAKLIFGKALQHFEREFSSEEVIIIGDTPKDIECAKAIQAKVVAVATGKYTEDELQQYAPDLLVPNLLDKRIIPFLIGKKK
jgi:phosphoglycolate phosphatase